MNMPTTTDNYSCCLWRNLFISKNLIFKNKQNFVLSLIYNLLNKILYNLFKRWFSFRHSQSRRSRLHGGFRLNTCTATTGWVWGRGRWRRRQTECRRRGSHRGGHSPRPPTDRWCSSQLPTPRLPPTNHTQSHTRGLGPNLQNILRFIVRLSECIVRSTYDSDL